MERKPPAQPDVDAPVPVYLNVGVTGHRDLVGAEIPRLEACVREFLQELRHRWPGLDLRLLTPLAEGSDRLAARVAVDLGISLVAVLPMAREEYERDFDSSTSREEFHALLAKAVRVVELPAPDSSARDIPLRDLQYAQAGVFVSSHSQILLALWDGRSGNATGGTAQVVRYHLTAVMDGFDDQPVSAELLADNENDLAYHVVCSRDRPDGGVASGLKPAECYWLTSLHGRSARDDLPAEYRIMLDRLNAFARDPARDVAESGPGGLPSRLPDGLILPGSARFASRLFHLADRLAVHYQKRVNHGLYSIHALAVLMGFVYIVYTEYTTPAFLVWVFLALFFAGLGIHLTGARREWHRKYLDYRGLAEALRVQFYWNLAGVSDPRSVSFVFESFLQKQDVELGWIRHVLRSASFERVRGVQPDPALVGWVIEHWIGNAKDGTGQLGYYTRKESVNVVKLRRTERLGAICLWFGISFAALLGLTLESLSDAQQNVLLVLMGMLPLIAGVSDAISYKRAEKELIRQYRFMARIFGNARRLLDEQGGLAFQRRVLKALGDAALEEGAEWILMHRTRPLEAQGLA